MEPHPSLLTKTEVAQMLGKVSVRFVNRLLEKGKLKKIVLGYRTVRIEPQSVYDYLDIIKNPKE